jgi:cell division protein FtsI (penicillin-binding protein 3)
MSIRQSILVRVRIAFLCMVAISLAVVAKILYIQVVTGDKWRKKAQANGLAFKSVTAMRGNITAEDGSLLATSTIFFQLAIDPTVAEDEVFNKGIDSLSMLLAKHFKEKQAKEIKTELLLARQEKKRYKILVNEPITFQQRNIALTFPILREKRKGGLILEKTQQRLRPFGDLAKRTIGFIQEDTGGVVRGRGLEISFHDQLAGTNGQALFQRIAGGAWKPVGDGEQIRPEDGFDIVTTIDIHLQEIVDKALRKALIQHNADNGCVILMEVQTGEIKAMANLGKDENGEYSEINNFATGEIGMAEPGSTFKLATFTALLEEADISLDDTVQTGNGTYKFAENAVMTDVKEGGYGKISVKEVFERSSNIGTSKMVFKYFRDKPQKYYEYLEKFHLTQPLNFQIAGEPTPFIKKPSNKTWSNTTLPWMSVGYELKVAPIHTLAFCNALANNGKLIQPIIVKAVKKGNKTVQEFYAKTLVPQIASEKTLRTMRTLMEGVVERGTATNIRTKEYKIAGKTGTAEKVEKGVYTEKHYASFVGYFPSDNPKYSCIVAIDNPKTSSQYGALVAAPVFREVADFAYKSYLMNNEFKKTVTINKPALIRAAYKADIQVISNELGFQYELPKNSDENTDWLLGRVRGDSLLFTNNKMLNALVPNVTGMSLRDALYVLENRGLQVVFHGKGKVKHQSLRIGTKVHRGDKIVLTLY